MKKLLIIALIFIFTGLLMTLTSCNDAIDTAKQEYAPSAMLKKYEWFKSQAEFVKKSEADVATAKNLSDSLLSKYKGLYGDVKSWDVLTKSNYQQESGKLQDAYVATIATCNKLIADYNTRSNEFNWSSFQGNTANLPQTYSEIKQ